MVTSSLSCGEFYILYIDPPCGHYAGDVTIMTIYCIVNRSYILNIGPLFCIKDLLAYYIIYIHTYIHIYVYIYLYNNSLGKTTINKNM